MAAWLEEPDDYGPDHDPDSGEAPELPFVCEWCGSAFTAADAGSPCCSVACSRAWQDWRLRQVRDPEPLPDGDTIPF